MLLKKESNSGDPKGREYQVKQKEKVQAFKERIKFRFNSSMNSLHNE